MYTVASYIIEVLRLLGVKRIYGLIGTSILDFMDTLYDYRDSLRLITTRHEQSAVSMADAEYRATGNLGAAIVHGGPGFLNTIISLGIAFKDRIPLILLSGGVKRRLYGTDAMHEVDQVSIVRPVTRYATRLTREEELPGIMGKIIKSAISKPRGPVMLEIPEDMWRRLLDANPRSILDSLDVIPAKPSGEDISIILDYMVRAEKPAILACGEVSIPGVEPLLLELAWRTGSYIIVTGNARGACDELDPRCLGRVGFGGGSLPADKVLEYADFLLVLGDELDDISTYGYNIVPKGEIIVVTENRVVELRPFYYSKLVYADPYETLRVLVETLRERGLKLSKPSWDSEVEYYKSLWSSSINEALSRVYTGYVNPSKFFKRLGEKLPDKHLVTGGQGVHIVYAYDFIKIRRARRFLAATRLAAMGYAFPAAIGAKLALPDHEVIAIVGDGEFMMTVEELETAVRENIPVKVVIVNDLSYRVLLLRQKIQRRGRIIGTLLGNPSFEALAKAFGARGVTVADDSEIDEAINEMLESDKPFVVDLRISQEDIPPLNIEASIRIAE
ncbi:MAG: thiamine pyrophosphate-binding protein [Acidilobaceae archaeon]